MEKTDMRKKTIARLNEMDEQKYTEKSQLIHDRLFSDPLFQQAETIGVTISAPPEVDTWKLIERLWQEGKRVAVPKCESKSRRMDFRLLESFEELETVYMKLKEPIVERTEWVAPASIDFLLVPGVVFSPSGYRIGFGGGFYDRFLVHYNGIARSLAFDIQIADELPVEAHDLPVGGIFTESTYIDSKKVRK